MNYLVFQDEVEWSGVDKTQGEDDDGVYLLRKWMFYSEVFIYLG